MISIEPVSPAVIGFFLGYVIVFAEQLEQLIKHLFNYDVSSLGEIIAVTIGLVVGQKNDITLDGIIIALPCLVLGLILTGGIVSFLKHLGKGIGIYICLGGLTVIYLVIAFVILA